MSLVRYNDLAVWEPLAASQQVSDTVSFNMLFTVPNDEIWEITSGGITLNTLGGTTRIAWVIAGNVRRLDTLNAPAANDTLPLTGTVWLPPGHNGFGGFVANGGPLATAAILISGRIWRI